MTLASQLKKKSKSINLDRLKNAAKAKQAEREKEARLAEKNLAHKALEKVRKKRRQVELKRLIKWLAPGLLLAWNQEDHIQYNPCSGDERITAKKYLGFTESHDHILILNSELDGLENNIRDLLCGMEKLGPYAVSPVPSILFDKKELLISYTAKTSLFSKKWRDNFLRETLHFEKSAIANHASKIREASARSEEEVARIQMDKDIMEVRTLAEMLKPSIDTFRNHYQSLMSSPSSVYLVRSGVSAFEGVNYVELVTSRQYQFAVAQYVLKEMNIHCTISYPDVVGKSMAAFRVASGEDLFNALLEHISDPDLTKKFISYSRILDGKPKNHKGIQLPAINGSDIAGIVNSIFVSVEKIEKALKALKIESLQINNGQISLNTSVRIDELYETAAYPQVDRLAYDIQWLRSSSGQKFKKEFTKYLDELAGNGKYTAKLKIFTEDDELLIELPSGKELLCDMDWDSFEQLMQLLDLEITETTATGIVKLKWG